MKRKYFEDSDWDYKKEVGERMAKNPDNMVWYLDFENRRVETEMEHKQRISERNIGIKSGVIVGVLIGLSISFLFDAIQKYIIQFNWLIDVIVSIVLILASALLLKSMKTGAVYFN